MKFSIKKYPWPLSILLVFMGNIFAEQVLSFPSEESPLTPKAPPPLHLSEIPPAVLSPPELSVEETPVPTDELSEEILEPSPEQASLSPKTLNTIVDTSLSTTAANTTSPTYTTPTNQVFDPSLSQGWSFDLSGQYTWMAFLTPPTYKGSSGGGQGKITYQEPNAYFGQLRTVYNHAPSLSTPYNSLTVSEWYSEFIGGYCFAANHQWSITPYAGIGFDFLNDHHSPLCDIPPIQVKYRIFYALVGLETHYTWENWMLGLQFAVFPTFNQYLKIPEILGTAWTLKQRIGFDAHISAAYRLTKSFWIDFSPYYRLLPIGASDVLGLPQRNLNEWGAFVSLRLFITSHQKRSHQTAYLPKTHIAQATSIPAEPDIIDTLIQYGNNPLKLPAINYAAYLGKEDVVSFLLKHGANINQPSSMSTPLEIALSHNHRKLAMFLITNKAAISSESASICCKNRLLDEFQTIVQVHPDIIYCDEIITTCCEHAFLDGLQLLFQKGAKVPDDFTSDQILHQLLSSGDAKYIPIVKFMITQGADCSYTKTYTINHGKTRWSAVCSVGLLVPALDYNDAELISLLIAHKAPLNSSIQNQIILTKKPHGSNNKQRAQLISLDPLYKAVFQGKFDMAKLLIAAGAQKNSLLDTEFNLLALAYSKEANIDLTTSGYLGRIKQFHELGFLNQETYFSPMMEWTIKEKSDIRWLSFLLDMGVKPQTTHLQWAIEKKDRDLIKKLLEHGALL